MSRLEDIGQQLNKVAGDASQRAISLRAQTKELSLNIRTLISVVQHSNNRVAMLAISQLQHAIQKLQTSAVLLDSAERKCREWITTSLLSSGGRAGSGSNCSSSSEDSMTGYSQANRDIINIKSIEGWLGNINPNYTGSPFSPFSSNCGSCAFAVESRFNGDGVAVASERNIGTDAGMEAVTGKTCQYMPVKEIEDHLIEQGPGSHLIIGINRYPTIWGVQRAGHWFNAYYDGEKIYTIDGQNGKIYDWPHDYGSISEWCALI